MMSSAEAESLAYQSKHTCSIVVLFSHAASSNTSRWNKKKYTTFKPLKHFGRSSSCRGILVLALHMLVISYYLLP